MRPQPEQVRDIAVAVRIKTIRGACQDLGKRPRGGIKISSKCTRLPLGGLVHETNNPHTNVLSLNYSTYSCHLYSNYHYEVILLQTTKLTASATAALQCCSSSRYFTTSLCPFHAAAKSGVQSCCANRVVYNDVGKAAVPPWRLPHITTQRE